MAEGISFASGITEVMPSLASATGGYTSTNVANNLANSCEMEIHLFYFTA